MILFSYQERSILGSLLALLGTATYFLSDAIPAIVAGTPLPAERLAPWVLALFLMMLAVELAYHVTLSLCARRDRRDERDVLIEAKAARNGYYVLGGGMIAFGFHATVWQMLHAEPAVVASVGVTVVVMLLVAAETSHLVSKLVYYRRGV